MLNCGPRSNSSAEQELAGEPEVLAEMRRRNTLDQELYDYAVALHKAQLEEEEGVGGK